VVSLAGPVMGSLVEIDLSEAAEIAIIVREHAHICGKDVG
jgi:hypothetical protein